MVVLEMGKLQTILYFKIINYNINTYFIVVYQNEGFQIMFYKTNFLKTDFEFKICW